MFTDKDRALHKGLIKVLDDATFQLKAREVAAFAEIYKWVINLPNLDNKKKVVKK
jgi:hypothetical protein